MAKDYWADPSGEKWQVKGAGNSRASALYDTQAEAWADARHRAKATSGEAYLQNQQGQIRARNTFGHDPKKTKG